MASLCPRGLRWHVQFTDKDGRRPIISFPKKGCPKGSAQTVKSHIEHLNAAAIAGTAPPVDTSRWVASCGDTLAGRLAECGLVNKRRSGLLGPFIDEFLAEREADPGYKPRTIATYRPTYKSLREFFGEKKPMRDITPGDMKRWRSSISRGRSENTTRKWTAKAKTLMNAAKDDRLIDASPMVGLKASTVAQRDRDRFVTREEIDRVLAACPSLEWRLIVVLARYAGLRCPSEIVELEWGDILWDQDKMIIRSVKTEHHEGHETRVVPIFPEVRPVLEEAYDAAPEGALAVVPNRNSESNLGTTFAKIVTRAGIAPWPKLFQNMRATRATELAEIYPDHVCEAWLGHSTTVAKKHYRQVTDEHFQMATTAETTAATASNELRRKEANA